MRTKTVFNQGSTFLKPGSRRTFSPNFTFWFPFHLVPVPPLPFSSFSHTPVWLSGTSQQGHDVAQPHEAPLRKSNGSGVWRWWYSGPAAFTERSKGLKAEKPHSLVVEGRETWQGTREALELVARWCSSIAAFVRVWAQYGPSSNFAVMLGTFFKRRW